MNVSSHDIRREAVERIRLTLEAVAFGIACLIFGVFWGAGRNAFSDWLMCSFGGIALGMLIHLLIRFGLSLRLISRGAVRHE